MRKLIFIPLFLVAATVQGQQLNLSSLDKLADRASETTEVTLDAAMLKFASAFLSDRKADEAAAKKMISELKGVYVRVFEFQSQGAFSPADLQPLRDQLKGPQWTRIVTVRERPTGEDVEIWLHREGDVTSAICVIAVEPRELAVVNLVGPIRPEDLGTLSGQFGIPTIEGLKKE